MGLLIAIARKVQLKSQRFELEHKQILISRAKSELASKISDYEMSRTDYEPDSAEAKAFNARIERLNQIDKRLDEQLERINMQLQLNEAEYNSCNQMVQSNLQAMYS